MMALQTWVDQINSVLWGAPLIVLLLGTGIYLTVGLAFMPIRKLGYGFRMLWQGRSSGDEGQISPFNALMTALSATIGTGNIAGVATAIAIGGPGALFWMWCTALVGMSTKFAEAVLAVKFREVDEKGQYVGGPMYYIKNGLSAKWKWLGTAFALFGALAGFGLANTVQSNSVAQVLDDTFGVPVGWTAVVITLLVAGVILGGIERIAQVAGKLVPLMAISYIVAGLIVVLSHISQVPAAIMLILDSAFNGHAATGGFSGAAIALAIRQGVARGIFSNEAGLGSAPIAHAAARTKDPVRQGVVAMLGTFIDTICVCTITGLAIVVTGVWSSGVNGAPLTTMAFSLGMPGGEYVVSVGLAVFAFTTMLGWCVYGERCAEYLFGVRAVLPFRLLWIGAIPLGAIAQLSLVWALADTLNALMAIPNLIALALLSPLVFKMSRDYFNGQKSSVAEEHEGA